MRNSTYLNYYHVLMFQKLTYINYLSFYYSAYNVLFGVYGGACDGQWYLKMAVSACSLFQGSEIVLPIPLGSRLIMGNHPAYQSPNCDDAFINGEILNEDCRRIAMAILGTIELLDGSSMILLTCTARKLYLYYQNNYYQTNTDITRLCAGGLMWPGNPNVS